MPRIIHHKTNFQTTLRMKSSHLILEVRFAHTFKRKNNETLIYQFTYVFISRIKMMCKLRDVTTVLTMRSDTLLFKNLRNGVSTSII